MAKLTDLQLVLLSAAARRDGGALLPLPKRLKIEPGALTRVLKGLLKRKLVTEQPAPPDAPAWREADDRRVMLVVTPAGFDAIGVLPEGAPGPAESNEAAPAARAWKRKGKRKPSGQKPRSASGTKPKKAGDRKPDAALGAARAGTKLALLIAMLERKDGTTIPEIVAATGWQQHSVRGAISGTLKKKRGLTVTSETVEGRGRTYRITAAGKAR